MKELIFKLGQSMTVERVVDTNETIITISAEAVNATILAIANTIHDKQFWLAMVKAVASFIDDRDARCS